ncbi:MAG: Ppx/GppA family phosphatase [Deltaproteobacteria bacterium]|nr:Ppx/GppA family phosphatase [Deltaproteobacteria bacterium]
MSVFATLDVGSNSVLLYVVRVEGDKTEVLVDRADLSRLGDGLRATGALGEVPMTRTVEALSGMVAEARGLGAEQIAAVGTMALRTATNADQFLARVEAATGVAIEVIPGEEEARLSYMAVRSGLPLTAQKVIVFDVGGGSTEFIYGDGDQIARRFSLDVGALRLTEEHLRSDPVSEEELIALRVALVEELAAVEPEVADALVGMGGAITNMVAVGHELTEYDADVVQGAALTVAEVERQLELYRAMPVADRAKLPGLQPKRADTILAGAAVVRTVMSRTGMNTVLVSVRGIRHGLMLDRFGVRG